MERGNQNAGVSGILTMQPEGITSIGDVTFAAVVTTHATGIRHRPIERTGRGDAGVPVFRLGDLRESFSFSGKLSPANYPTPTGSKFATGTLTRQMHTGLTIATPVRITGLDIRHNEKKDEAWDVSGTAIQNGEEVITWNGTRVTVSAPAANDKETYAGMQKTYDANGIVTAAVQRYDCEGVGDTDSAEAAKLAALVASLVTPPMEYLKVVTAYFTKDPDDSTGCQIVIQWGLKDTAEQIEFGGTRAVRNVGDPGEDVDVEVIDDTRTAKVIADDVLSTFRTELYAKQLVVTKENAQKAVVRKIYRGSIGIDPNAYYVTSDLDGRQVRRAYKTESNTTSVYATLNQRIATESGTPFRQIQLGFTEITELHRFIGLRREFVQTTVPDYPQYVGYVNTNVFLGLSAGSVMYMGAKSSALVNSSGNNSIIVTYGFLWRNIGHTILTGWQPMVYSNVDNAARGWISLTDFADLGIAATSPSTVNFSIFLP